MSGTGESSTAEDPRGEDSRPLARRILALAIPALGALLAEPLFLLADTVIIGRLGVEELAGAALGITVMHTVTGLMIFLAYSTTPAVARYIGAGRLSKALAAGRDGLWLALMQWAVAIATTLVSKAHGRSRQLRSRTSSMSCCLTSPGSLRSGMVLSSMSTRALAR